MAVSRHLLVQRQRTDIGRALTILPQPQKTSKQGTQTLSQSQKPGSPRLHRQPHKSPNRGTGCINQGGQDNEDILRQKMSGHSQLPQWRQSLVGRIQYYHDATQQEIGRETIWTLQGPWKRRTCGISSRTPHYVEENSSSLQRSTPHPLQTTHISPTTTILTSTTCDHRRRRRIQDG